MPMVDPVTLAKLFDQHAAALRLFARQWTSTPEDVVQEAFVSLARQTALPENPAAWLFRVTRNAAINEGKAARARQNREVNRSLGGPSWFEATSMDDQIDGERVAIWLEELDGEEREALVAHLWGDLSFAEIGTLLGTSAATAHRRYQAGLARLQKRSERACEIRTIDP